MSSYVCCVYESILHIFIKYIGSQFFIQFCLFGRRRRARMSCISFVPFGCWCLGFCFCGRSPPLLLPPDMRLWCVLLVGDMNWASVCTVLCACALCVCVSVCRSIMYVTYRAYTPHTAKAKRDKRVTHLFFFYFHRALWICRDYNRNRECVFAIYMAYAVLVHI